MRIKITQVLTFLLFYTSAMAEKSYHSTDTLLTRVKLKCATVPQLSCHMKDDILIVDYNQHVSNKADILLVFNEHSGSQYAVGFLPSSTMAYSISSIVYSNLIHCHLPSI